MKTKLLFACGMGVALAALAAAQAPVMGPEIPVHPTNAEDVWASDAANLGPAGDFVVTWTSYDYGGGYDYDAVGRRFSTTGVPLGEEFSISANPAEDQFGPRVASNAAGHFVVTWTTGEPGTPPAVGWDVRARRFDSSGTPLGDDIVVNQYTAGRQTYPSVALDAAGAFVVVWNSFPEIGPPTPGQDGDGAGIFGRRFDSSGNPLGDEFLVNQYTTGDQYAPRIAMSPAGDFVVAWNDYFNSAIRVRRYDSAGAPLGDEVKVNGIGWVYDPDVALDGDGNVIVVWDTVWGFASVLGQRLDAQGNKIGPEFHVTADPWGYGPRGLARVAVASDGGSAAVWYSRGQDGDGYAMVSQLFDPTGRRVGGELVLNTFTTGDQLPGSIIAQPNGQFVATWTSRQTNGSDSAIAARVLGFPTVDPIGVDVPHAGAVTAPGSSNLNGVLEAGEQVTVETAFRNASGESLALSGTASDLQGPGSATYTLVDTTADYGTIAAGGGSDCFQATGDCFELSVTGARPVAHWDARLTEALSYEGFTRTAPLHIGESFADVPTGNPFYPLIENLFHNGVTGGCSGGNFCSNANVTREQMAAFLLKARYGADFFPPEATGDVFTDVPASDSFAPWIEELSREGITGGCGGTLYCPDSPVTREQMAAFLLKTLEGAAYVPPPCAAVFADVPCPGPFADWIGDLHGRGITGGCQAVPLSFCPSGTVLRQQMAAFLVKTFGLRLY